MPKGIFTDGSQNHFPELFVILKNKGLRMNFFFFYFHLSKCLPAATSTVLSEVKDSTSNIILLVSSVSVFSRDTVALPWIGSILGFWFPNTWLICLYQGESMIKEENGKGIGWRVVYPVFPSHMCCFEQWNCGSEWHMSHLNRCIWFSTRIEPHGNSCLAGRMWDRPSILNDAVDVVWTGGTPWAMLNTTVWLSLSYCR